MQYLDEWQADIRKLTSDILGSHVMRSPDERALRCFEECCEMCQALDLPKELLQRQLYMTYRRPKDDDVGSEIGAVAYTLLAVAESLNLSLYNLIQRTYEKCSRPDIQQRMKSRQKEKLHPEGFVP
jgi:NTP pyrophosphatase (non-canonical NTP hydrolase)